MDAEEEGEETGSGGGGAGGARAGKGEGVTYVRTYVRTYRIFSAWHLRIKRGALGTLRAQQSPLAESPLLDVD